VRVTRVFEANSTAYMVMRFERGRSFEAWLKELGRPPTQQELDAIVAKLLDALEAMHAANFLHRDIAPDNIIIRADDTPVLLDFGAARRAVAEMSHSLTGIVKAGYSPHEQYSTDGRLQGPWSDIYALGGTLYRAVTGKQPEESMLRFDEDHMPSAVKAAKGTHRREFLAAIDACLKVRHAERPRSIAQLRPMLLGQKRQAKPRRNRLLDVFRPSQPARTRHAESRSTRRWPVIAAAMLAVLGGAYGGYEYTHWLPTGRSDPEAEARRRAAEAAARQQAELEAERRRKEEAEAAAKRQAELEADRRRKEEVEEAAKRRQAELDAERRRKEEAEEAARRRQAELEAEHKRKEEEEAAKRRQAELDAERRRKEGAEEAARRRQAELDAERQRKEEAEEAARRRQAELEVERQRKAAAEEAARKKKEAEEKAAAADKAQRAAKEAERKKREEERIALLQKKEAEERPRAGQAPPGEVLIPSQDGAVTAIATDGQWLATGTEKGTVQLWQLSEGTAAKRIGSNTLHAGARIAAIALGHDDTAKIAASDLAGKIAFWDVQSNRVRHAAVPGQQKRVFALRYHAATKQFMAISVVRGKDNTYLATVERWRPDGRVVEEPKPIEVGGRPIEAAAFAPNDDLIAVVARPNRLLILNSGRDTPIFTEPLRGYAHALVFSPDGRRVAVAGQFEQIRISEDMEGKRFGRPIELELRTLSSQRGADIAVVTALAFSPDGRFIASANLDDKVAVWDTQSPMKPLAEYEGRRQLPAEPIKWLSLLQPSPGKTVLVMPWNDGTTRRMSVGAGE
jgi:hypothetical protein